MPLSKNYELGTLANTLDIDQSTGESAEVQAICNAVHTQAIKDAYAAHLAAQASEE